MQKDFQKNIYSLSNNIQIFGKYTNIGAVLEATVKLVLLFEEDLSSLLHPTWFITALAMAQLVPTFKTVFSVPHYNIFTTLFLSILFHSIALLQFLTLSLLTSLLPTFKILKPLSCISLSALTQIWNKDTSSLYLNIIFPYTLSHPCSLPISLASFVLTIIVHIGSLDFGQYQITESECLTVGHGLLYSFTYYGIFYVSHLSSI